MFHSHKFAVFALTVALTPATLAIVTAADADFLRGDANSDGVVSVADAHTLDLLLFQGMAIDCLSAADTNDDGRVDIADTVYLLNALSQRGVLPPPPFPSVGPDPTNDELDCNQYGGGEPVVDPNARIEIVAATAEGGDNAAATIEVRVAHSNAAAGFSGELVSPGVIAGVEGTERMIEEATGFDGASFSDGVVKFAFLYDLLSRDSLPPDPEGRSVIQVTVCLSEGLAAGSYPLTLRNAEVIDAATGARIDPDHVDGTLTVAADVSAGVSCVEPPFGVDEPGDVEVRILLDEFGVESGTTVSMPCTLISNALIEGFSFSIDFDETQVNAANVIPESSEWETLVFEINNNDDVAGSTEIAEGYVAGWAIFGDSPETFLPPTRTHDLMTLELDVLADAESGTTPLSFVDGGLLDGTPVTQSVRALGVDIHPDDAREFILGTGRLFIDPEGTAFLRGDVNSDGVVSIADSAMLRRYLFLEGTPPPCLDAADTNDDGAVNLVDTILILGHIFNEDLEVFLVERPYPTAGLDLTLDTLTCEVYEPVTPAEEPGDLVRLDSVAGAPGTRVGVPILVTSSVPVEAYQLVVAYNPEIFRPRGRIDFTDTVFESQKSEPNFVVVEEHPEDGVFLVGFIGSLISDGYEVPPGEDVLAGTIIGAIDENAEPDTELLLDLTNGPDGNGVGPKQLRNELTHQGEARFITVFPRVEGGVLKIVGDITFFRGDANQDGRLGIADPIFTLNHLFGSGRAPVCPDAADSNDNGDIDISDALFTLNYLFTGTVTMPEPTGEKGTDPTEDDLGVCGFSG